MSQVRIGSLHWSLPERALRSSRAKPKFTFSISSASQLILGKS
jgi:hypothetical protein